MTFKHGYNIISTKPKKICYENKKDKKGKKKVKKKIQVLGKW